MKIIYEREKCIGCGTCTMLCQKYWKIAEDGKAKLLNSQINPKTGNEELDIKKVECNQEAVDSCPVQCIHVTK